MKRLLPIVACLSFGACLDGANAGPDVRPTDDTPEVSSETSAPDVVDPDTAQPEVVEPDAAQPETDTVVPSPTSYELKLGGWTMAPGQETTRCVVVRLGNADKIWVPRIRTALAKGSHHFVVYRSKSTTEQKEPFSCAPFSETLGGDTVPLFISQTRNETLELPPGVAFELEANQMIRLEAHYLNYYTEPIVADATITFDTSPTDAPPLIADFLFYGTTEIRIPSGQSVTTPWNYLSVPAGLQVFAMTGHTHALGTNVEVEYKRPGEPGALVYPPPNEVFRWSEAPIAYFDEPLNFDGGNGFNFRCSWTNTTNQDVYFGESAHREMCFFWAYYYPSQGFLVRF